MSVDVRVRATRSVPPPPPAAAGRRGRRWVVGVGLAATLTLAAWLPFVSVPLSPDESGFLLLARQWHPGRSLYGNYWVDRPPLLLWLFALAGHVVPVTHSARGLTAPGVKLLGGFASSLTVVLTGVISRLLAPHQQWRHAVTVLAAVALLSSPFLGMPETNGEVLALPFVLLGMTCLIAASRGAWRSQAALLTAAAGASAMGAALVKQNVIDVFVFALVLLFASHRHVSQVAARCVAFLGGSILALAATVLLAGAQGTTPVGLWDAAVVFRLRAAAVIGASASSATSERLAGLAGAGVASGALVLLVVAAGIAVAGALRSGRRCWIDASLTEVAESVDGRTALTWAGLAVAVWELFAVAAGGSYWLHYLTGLVPGLLLLLAAVRTSRRSRRVLSACVCYVVVASAVALTQRATLPFSPSDDAQVVRYLRHHAGPADGVVVGFGHPDLVAGSGLSSPYEYLWSLPVRVLDPHLTLLGRVLTGPDAPRWVVVAGDSLDSWGLDATSTQRILERRYHDQVTDGVWQVWRRRGKEVVK